MPIRILPETVAAQIAAGEVVERPASVVKELLENALDAGAGRIAVEVEHGGKRLIRVNDDGAGIPSEEAPLAFERHATSKLAAIEDLDHLHTLGFRGEALASIAAVSRVTLVTRHRDALMGAEVQVEGGELRYNRPSGAPIGTVVTVENLFFNTPARLKFLKSESTERKHIAQLVTRYAMAYPQVRFRLVQDGRAQFHSTGSGDLADVLVDVFGLDVFREMIEVGPTALERADLPPIEVYGFASAPNLTRSNRSHIVLFVNGRAIADQSLSYAVVQAYHTLIPQGRYPLAVLLITLPPEEVDVNVHPTKAEVRFRSPDAVFAAVHRAVRHAVIAQAPVPSVGKTGGMPSASPQGRTPIPGEEQLRMTLETLDPGRYAQQRPRTADDIPPAGPPVALPETEIPVGPQAPARPRTLPVLRVVGQVGATYIVAEGPAGMYLIDQHAAHERILYERLMAQQAAREPVRQQTLRTSVLELSPDGAHLLEASLEALEGLGFEIEPFGASAFRIRAVPALLADRDPVEVLEEVLAELESGKTPGAKAVEDQIVLHICKAVAVKAGQILSLEEMQGLLRQLERCEFPRTCPHGRPTMIHMSGAELARLFGRT